MKLSKQQVQQILINAPAGADKTKIIDTLVSRGYQLEGYSQPAPQQPGLVGSLVKGMADPFLKLGATFNALGTSKYLGGPGTNNQEAQTPLGPVKPITTGKEALGVGGELAGYAIGNPVASGALFGAGSVLSDGGDYKEAAKQAVIGAGTGLALAGASAGLSKLKNYLTDVAPESLMNHAVKPTLDELRKNVKYGTPTLGKELLNAGVKGDTKSLLQIADTNLTQSESQLQKLLESSNGVIRKDEVLKYAQPTIEKLNNTPGGKEQAAKLLEIFNDMPDTVTASEANVIKRNIYDEIRNVAYKFDPTLVPKKQAMKLMANGLKTEIEKASGNPEAVQALNKQLSMYGRLEDRIVDLVARNNRNQLVKMGDALMATVGFSHPLAFVTLASKHASESPGVLTNVAQGLNKLAPVGKGPVAKAVKTAGKKILVSTPANLNRYLKQ